MRTLKEIKNIIARHKKDLKKKYSVEEIGIFGSYVRKKQKEKSDLDVLVKFKEPVSLLKVVNLENHLEEIIGIRVDLIPKKDVRPELKKIIFKEVAYL